MNITRNNYEIYFIDYHDGNLNGEQSAELFLFLELNSDLKEEFENFSSISIDIPQVEFPLRDAMKRGEINEQNFSWYMSASVEGDLSPSEQLLLENFISDNSKYKKEADLFHIAKLDAGNEIYPNKKSLKQPVPFVFSFTRTLNYAIAAMIFLSLIAGGYFIYTKSLVQKNEGVAEIPVEKSPSSPVLTDTNTYQNINVLPKDINKVIPANDQLVSVVQPKMNVKFDSIQPIQNNVMFNNIDEIPHVAEVAPEESAPEELIASNPEPIELNQSDVDINDNDEYVSVWEAIRNGAEKNLRKAIKKDDDYTLADGSKEQPIRILDVVSKGVEKISNDKVTVDAAYADNGKVSGFRFAAGKFSIEKNNP